MEPLLGGGFHFLDPLGGLGMDAPKTPPRGRAPGRQSLLALARLHSQSSCWRAVQVYRIEDLGFRDSGFGV